MQNGGAGETSSIELKNMAQYGTNGKTAKAAEAAKEAEAMENVLSPSEDESTSGPEDPEGGEGGKKKKDKKKRDTWDNKAQFLLSLIGYAVGLGNVWRFSYLCARNGGSAFLFPYLIMLFVLGIPLFYLELSLGQTVRKGPVGAWFKVSKNLGGIGIAAAIVNTYISIYYNVIIAWVLFYFVNSFHKLLPWSKCFGFYSLSDNLVNETANFTGDVERLDTCLNGSTEYYWYNNAVRISDSINEAGDFNWQMFLCLIAAWVIIYFCLFRGIQSSGKIVYVTAIFPYLVLIALFFRAVTLPGAGDGLKALFLPGDGWRHRLFEPQVWLEAATQIFFSLGVSIGALVALASYTKPKYNTLGFSFVVCLLNSLTSIFASIIIFAVIGFKAKRTNSTIELDTSGPGLAFISFTEALIHMPLPPLWAVLFFIMLFTLGLDSQFGALEGLLTVFGDAKYIRKLRKELITAIVCVSMFIVSIPFIIGNGVYLFELFDQFAGTIPLLFIGFFEFIAVGWIYGVDNFFNKLGAQLYHPRLLWVWRIMWKFVDPLVMVIIFFASIINEIIDPLQYSRYTNLMEVKEDYPEWARFIGACIVLSSALAIPVVAIVRLIAFQSARDEALDAIKRIRNSFKDFFDTVYGLIKHRCGNWRPQVDEEDMSTPYEQLGNAPLPAATVITSTPPPPSYQSSSEKSSSSPAHQGSDL